MAIDTTVNNLVINVLSKAQYNAIENKSETELYLVPDEIDTVPTNLSENPITSGAVHTALQGKLPLLVSGTNIKTVNFNSLLGSGDVSVGTVTSVTINGTNHTPTNGTVDLGTVSSDEDLVVTVDRNNLSIPSGTYSSITTAISSGKDVIIKALHSFGDVSYYHLCSEINSDNYYTFIGGSSNRITVVTITSNDTISISDTYIPSAVTESTVSGWGFTKNAGTITGITMNGASKGTSGIVDLGTVITSHQDISGKANDNAVVHLSGNENISGNKVFSDNVTIDGSNLLIDTASTIKYSAAGTETDMRYGFAFLNSLTSLGLVNIVPFLVPRATASDNGKMAVVDGDKWSLITPVKIYSGSSAPSSSTGVNGDIYIQTT